MSPWRTFSRLSRNVAFPRHTEFSSVRVVITFMKLDSNRPPWNSWIDEDTIERFIRFARLSIINSAHICRPKYDQEHDVLNIEVAYFKCFILEFKCGVDGSSSRVQIAQESDHHIFIVHGTYRSLIHQLAVLCLFMRWKLSKACDEVSTNRIGR